MKPIRRFFQLSRSEQGLLIRITWILIFVTLGLRFLHWMTLQNFLIKRAKRHTRFMPVQRPSSQRIGWLVSMAGRYIPKATCLPQALVAQFELIRYAYPADLQIGVARQEDGKLAAHAWVVSEGNIIVGAVHDLDRYMQLSAVDRQFVVKHYGRAF